MEDCLSGIDIAKRKFDVVLRLPDARVRVKAFPNDARATPRCGAGSRGPRARARVPGGHRPTATGWRRPSRCGPRRQFVNPAIIEAYARSCLTRTKTDPTDARLIAQFCATQQPRPGYPCRQRCAHCRPSCAGSTRSRGCARKSATGSPPTRRPRCAIPHACDCPPRSGDGGRAAAPPRACRLHPHLRQQRDLLTSIPGIGDATAAVLLAEFGPMGRFRQARAAAAFQASSTRGSLRNLPAPSPAPLEARCPGHSQGPVPSGAHRLAL